MSERRQCAYSTYDFTWEIKNFLKNIQTNTFDLVSLSFNLKCIEVTTWSIELIPIFNENEYRISCFLTRMTDGDELDSLAVSLTISVEDGTGSLHLKKRIPPCIVENKEDGGIKFNFVGRKRAVTNVNFFGSLILHFKIYVSADPLQTSRFNFNYGLQKLSMDMQDLYSSTVLKDALIEVKDSLLWVNLAVLHARWPNFTAYYMQFPGLVLKDSRHFYSIQTEILIRAAILLDMVCDANKDLQNFIEEKACHVTEILTSEILNYLLFHAYTGLCKSIKEDIKPDFIRLCRLFQFERLLEKHQDIPVASICRTDAPEVHYILDWSQEDGRFWASTNFQPFVQIIEPNKRNFGLLELEFIILDDNFIINFKNLEKRNPFSLSCVIVLKDEIGFENVVLDCCRIGLNDEIWPIDVSVTKTDIPFVALTIDLTIHCCYESKIVKKEFELTAEKSDLSQSLLNYSVDFEVFFLSDVMPDMVVVAEGRFFELHKYILCARSSQFLKELREKLSRDHKFTHLVRGIKFDTLEDMLAYTYSGRLEMEEIKDARALLKAADRYKLKFLVNMCKNYLSEMHAKTNK
ncbi:hypothetical protein NPIL_168961 [Nephila pilipes]|uniref:BTB domain-containing protein n=1 Tax=Nephila pilipes TaxID=299642 RepID=A0A8X6UB89_NEPPI|nr:hypothetical protein NPIL_168961 [Nephila pilipes]